VIQNWISGRFSAVAARWDWMDLPRVCARPLLVEVPAAQASSSKACGGIDHGLPLGGMPQHVRTDAQSAATSCRSWLRVFRILRTERTRMPHAMTSTGLCRHLPVTRSHGASARRPEPAPEMLPTQRTERFAPESCSAHDWLGLRAITNRAIRKVKAFFTMSPKNVGRQSILPWHASKAGKL